MNINFKDHIKPLIEDKEIIADARDVDLSQRALRRLYAVKKSFVDVNFKQSEISQCYFRNCRFTRCDFTGTSISKSNFRGSQYEECKFSYSTWEHTILDEEFLDNCLPSEENLARDLVRCLRVNFGQIGNYSAVNKAAAVEVALTGLHLFHATYSKQSYHRAKYKGWMRVVHGVRHAKWKVLDWLWGNGESLYRIVICGFFVIIIGTTILSWQNPQYSWQASLGAVATGFWGSNTSVPVPGGFLAALTAIRFLLSGLFMAVLIKRLSRR